MPSKPKYNYLFSTTKIFIRELLIGVRKISSRLCLPGAPSLARSCSGPSVVRAIIESFARHSITAAPEEKQITCACPSCARSRRRLVTARCGGAPRSISPPARVWRLGICVCALVLDEEGDKRLLVRGSATAANVGTLLLCKATIVVAASLASTSASVGAGLLVLDASTARRFSHSPNP